MSEGASGMEPSTEKRVSPPKAIVDSSPLTMDKNRESLKVKLLVRRSQSQLVEQNILPPLKTSPAIHEQRKLLERAKTGDLLKAKIQQRPNRSELERRHILESHEGHIDPSLADKYRMLEKAILVDQLNSKISHRPGPLELIEKNILHANEPIERIVKEGLVPFKVGNEDNLKETNFLSFEDDSQSSESDLFQQKSQLHPEILIKKDQDEIISKPTQSFEAPSTGVINISLVPSTSNMSAPISVATFKIHNPCAEKNEISAIPTPPPPPKLELITYHVKPILQTQVKGLVNAQGFLPIQIAETPMTNVSSLTTTPNLLPPQTQTSTVNQHVSSFIQNNQKYSAPGKDKNRKKCKNKAVSKRAIKFHEYKGPTNKNSSSCSSTSSSSSASMIANKKAGETNFELIMQQQCLLEYLEGIYKNPHATQSSKSESELMTKHGSKAMKIESTSDYSCEDKDEKSSKTFNKPHVMIFPSKPSSQISTASESTKDSNVSDVGKLAKMKVSELKAYLKRINLPVSGPKPLLIERLKPYLPLKPLEDNDDTSVSSNMMSEGNDFYNSSLHSVSSTESEMDNMDQFGVVSSSSSKDEDIVAEQQRKIEELQRKLQQSQQKLQELEQMKQNKIDVPSTSQQHINQQKVVFEPQYPMDQISTVYVVDVSQATSTQDEAQQVSLASPVKVKTQMLLEATPSSTMLQGNTKLSIPLATKEESHETSSQSTKDVIATSPIPMSQDITDVLEILLKNGEWPEISDVKIDGSFSQNSNDEKNFIEAFNSNNIDHFDHVLSPMLQEEAIDKILDTVPQNTNNSILHESFPTTFSNENNNIEFPMDIEDDSLLVVNTDFNRNFSTEFLEKPPPYDFNGLKMDNCDIKYNQYEKSVVESSQDNLKSPSIKTTEFPMLQKSPTKNGLIGNFDHNLFETLKSNNINNNNELFLIPQDTKDSKSLINNLHLSTNFDIFNIDNTPMDFDDLHQISGFENALGRGGTFNNGSNFFNDEGMTCEDNLLCNL